jgi:hypothetical protein
MTSIPPTIAAELALTRQNVALSVVKASAEADKAVANILDQAVQNAPVSSSRGVNVNRSV